MTTQLEYQLADALRTLCLCIGHGTPTTFASTGYTIKEVRGGGQSYDMVKDALAAYDAAKATPADESCIDVVALARFERVEKERDALKAECARLRAESEYRRECYASVVKSSAKMRDEMQAECAKLREQLAQSMAMTETTVAHEKAAREECTKLRERVAGYRDLVDYSNVNGPCSGVSLLDAYQDALRRATRAEARLEALTGDASAKAACAAEVSYQSDPLKIMKEALAAARQKVMEI